MCPREECCSLPEITLRGDGGRSTAPHAQLLSHVERLLLLGMAITRGEGNKQVPPTLSKARSAGVGSVSQRPLFI